MSRRRIALLLALALSFSCAREERRTEAPAANGLPQDGGTLVRRLDTDVATLHPLRATSRNERYVANYLFTPLVYLDRELEPVAGLAESWKISDDGLLYTFELNEDATFSDGTPVRASDVVFTIRKIVDPASEAVQIASGFASLDPAKLRAVGDTTVEVGFREPLASQLLRFNDVLVIPERIYGTGDFATAFDRRVVGSGPYKLLRHDRGRELVLERRDDYWTDKPHIDKVIFKVIQDHNVAWNALRKGEIDETAVASDVWLHEKENASLARTIRFERFYALNYNFIAWNLRNPSLADSRVRRALAMCVPTESLVQELYRGTARAMSGPFTPDMWAYNPNVPVLRYDPEEATKLLAAAGWKRSDGESPVEREGKPLEIELLIMSGGASTKQFAQMLQSELGRIGVTLKIVTLDGSAAIQRILDGNFEAAYMSWDLDPDPDPFALFHSSQLPPSGQNFVFYVNEEADRLLVEARRELDQSKRKLLYARLHELLAADQPYTWTFQVSSKWAVNRRVQGVELSRGFGPYLWYPGEFAWWIASEENATQRGR